METQYNTALRSSEFGQMVLQGREAEQNQVLLRIRDSDEGRATRDMESNK